MRLIRTYHFQVDELPRTKAFRHPKELTGTALEEWLDAQFHAWAERKVPGGFHGGRISSLRHIDGPEPWP
jgi:hypothetical protein